MLPPYTLVVVLQLPGPSTNYSIVFYFVPKLEFIKLFEPNLNPLESKKLINEMRLPPKYDDMIQEFFFGSSDKARNERLKMIPRITDGPWVIRNSVPSKPVLMGKRLPVRYFIGDQHLELDLDIGGGTKTARNLTSLGVGYASSIGLEVCFVLEGHECEELPEEVLAIASLVKPDLNAGAVSLVS